MLTADLLFAIALMALVTFGQKVIPFVALASFKNRPSVSYLAERLPPAVMLILVMYALSIQWAGFSKQSLAPILASAMTALIHIYLRNVLASIVVGTLVFAVLSKFVN